MTRFTWVAVLIALAALPLAARAQNAGELQQALDRKVTFEITTDTPIGEVFDKLGQKTGVEFVIDQDTWDLLPYGQRTQMRLTLPGISLRQALPDLLRQLALDWKAQGGTVRIHPSEELYRIGRRVDHQELRTLGALLTRQIQPADPAKEDLLEHPLSQIRNAIGVKDFEIAWHVKGDARPHLRRAQRALPGTPADWLDMICHGQDWTWYVWQDTVIVLPKAQQVERQLKKVVAIQRTSAKLADVLLDLARDARVPLIMEPGVMQLVPEDLRDHFSIKMHDSVAQAFEIISGVTGLAIETGAEGITVRASVPLLAKAGMAPQRDRPAVRFLIRSSMQVGDKTVDVFLPATEFPDDVVEAIKLHRDDLITEIRTAYPTTQPAE